MKIVGSGIIIRAKRVLLIKRFYSKRRFPNHWSFPGGGAEEGETPEETAIREVWEEVGLNLINPSLYLEVKTATHHFFRFTGIGEGRILIQEEECDGYGWFTFEEANQLLLPESIREIITGLSTKGLL